MMNTKFLKKASTYNYVIIAFITVLSIFLGYSTIKELSISSKEFTGKVITLEDVKNNNSPSLDLVMSHVKNIAKTAHPSGSDAIIDVRNYITEQISKMGLKYEFQSLVKVGPENPKHKFVMMAHYDSVKSGPGAGDDALSVGSLLECMRILSLKKDLKNTVYFLITDGEELGMVGGEYFVKNPLFDPNEITMITNFEARGSKGVPFMYRSSENNKNLLKILSKNADKKWTFSWLPEIFKIMPNASDLGLFIDAGYRGLDFAMAQDFKNYHRPTDSFENLSVKSANQYLKMTSDFVNYFSNVEKIEPDSNENAVAFPVSNGKIMILSSFLMKIFGIAISVLGLVFLIFAFIKKKYKIKDFLICTDAVLASLSLAVLLFLFQNWLPRMFYWLFSC